MRNVRQEIDDNMTHPHNQHYDPPIASVAGFARIHPSDEAYPPI